MRAKILDGSKKLERMDIQVRYAAMRRGSSQTKKPIRKVVTLKTYDYN